MFGVFAQREARRDARLLALGKGGRPVGGGPSFVPVSNADAVRSPVPGAPFLIWQKTSVFRFVEPVAA